MSAETTTTASSSVPPITGQLGYRGISVEEQTALVEAEIARRRKAAMEMAAKSRLAYQQNYAATTGPVSRIIRTTSLIVLFRFLSTVNILALTLILRSRSRNVSNALPGIHGAEITTIGLVLESADPNMLARKRSIGATTID